ncbi:hypothetical protein [Rhodocaloribacter litoris]|uniref:hypothetical protein n=1 Tax=Rhodocaloribacter litoris TaxID=2558931 RepID=UPI001E5A206F|nr:hypothetical protein [Rhodocaloribacter litoris]
MLAVLFFLTVTALALWPADARGQRRAGAVGLGAQIGEPSGVSLMVYRPRAMSYDFLAAWDLDDFFFFNVHGLYEHHLDRREQVHLYYGPGVFIGFRDRPRDRDDETVAGLSGRLGLGFLIDRFEIYGQITPRLAVTPATDGDIGGGVGFRFFFD